MALSAKEKVKDYSIINGVNGVDTLRVRRTISWYESN